MGGDVGINVSGEGCHGWNPVKETTFKTGAGTPGGCYFTKKSVQNKLWKRPIPGSILFGLFSPRKALPLRTKSLGIFVWRDWVLSANQDNGSPVCADGQILSWHRWGSGKLAAGWQAHKHGPLLTNSFLCGQKEDTDWTISLRSPRWSLLLASSVKN